MYEDAVKFGSWYADGNVLEDEWEVFAGQVLSSVTNATMPGTNPTI